jgi:hypothetical protein
MIHLSLSIIFELVLGFFLWWMAVYLFTQNPFSRIIQLAAGLFGAVSFYFTTDLFLYLAQQTHQYSVYAVVLRSFSWALYLPVVFLYHASLTLIPASKKSKWQTLNLYYSYFFAIALMIVEGTTNLIRNYSLFYSSNFSGGLDQATGKYFWLIGLFILPALVGAAINFYVKMKGEKSFSRNWYKYFWPMVGLGTSAALGVFVLLSYYDIIPHPIILPVIDLALIVVPLVYSILRYNLFFDEAKTIFGKNFIYSTLSVIFLLALYFTIIFLVSEPLQSIHNTILPFAFAYLLIASHPIYNWLSTFINDLVFNAVRGFSVVNDDEVAQALRDINKPERLEESSLLRLNAVARKVSKGEACDSLEALIVLLKEAIEYFKPELNTNQRLKRNLKYLLLKMYALDEAEEGQILWELGFDEYPVRIMTRETKERPPKFKAVSPADYTYTSRNAYLALKKEAIHDVTWRISYLEKLTRRKVYK